MIRQLLLFFVLLLAITANCFAQFPYVESFGPKPKGKIDSVIAPQFGRSYEINIFNKKGQLAEYYEYGFTQNPDFNVQTYDTTKTVYEYDKKGLLVKSIRTYSRYDTGLKPTYNHSTDTTTWHFVKEGNGYLAKFDYHFEKESKGCKTFKLNSALKLIEETDSSRLYIEDKLSTYDKNGYLVKRQRTSKSHGEIFSYEEYYTNDADGNIILKATNGPIFKFTHIRYDKMHNWVERNTYKLDPEEMEDYFLGKLERRITYHK